MLVRSSRETQKLGREEEDQIDRSRDGDEMGLHNTDMITKRWRA